MLMLLLMVLFFLNNLSLTSSITFSRCGALKPSVQNKNTEELYKIIATSSNKSEAAERWGWLPNGFRNGMASGMAAAVVKSCLQPFDTVKTVQQAQMNRITPLGAMREVISTRGVRGLWSGIGITILGSTPSVALYFGVYSSTKARLTQQFSPEYKMVAVALSALIGNTIASIARVPYEVIKQRMQYGLHSSAIEAIRHSIKTEGPLGLFGQGKLASQIIRDVPYAVVTLCSYELLQAYRTRALTEKSTSSAPGSNNSSGGGGGGGTTSTRAGTDALCGATAGGIGTICTQPFDVIKTRMMTTKQYPNVATAALRIFRHEGPRTFYVGLYPRLLHKIPANALFFLCYEAFRTLLGVDADTR